MESPILTSSDKILYRVLSRIYRNLRQLHPSRVYNRIRRFMRSRSNKQALTTLKHISQGNYVRTSAQKTIVSKQLAQLLVGLLILSGGSTIYLKQIRDFIGLVTRTIRNVLGRQGVFRVLMRPITKLLGYIMKKSEGREGMHQVMNLRTNLN